MGFNLKAFIDFCNKHLEKADDEKVLLKIFFDGERLDVEKISLVIDADGNLSIEIKT